MTDPASLADALVGDPSVRAQYVVDPASVLARYGVDATDEDALHELAALVEAASRDRPAVERRTLHALVFLAFTTRMDRSPPPQR